MTLAHFIYIPGVLLVGLVIGYVLGGRAEQMQRAERSDRCRVSCRTDRVSTARDRL